MKSESLNKLAWLKLKKNKLSLFALYYIFLVLFIGIFAVVISPDSSINANEMHIELANKKPLSKILFLEIQKNMDSDFSFIKSLFIGNSSKLKRVPIDSFKILDSGIKYLPYSSQIEQQYIGKYKISEQIFWFGTDRFGRDCSAEYFMESVFHYQLDLLLYLFRY